MLREAAHLARNKPLAALLQLEFSGASSSFRVAVWPVVVEHFTRSATGILPMLVDGKLTIADSVPAGATLIPWTPAGYGEFVGLALGSGLKWGELDQVARRWWDRSFPRGLALQPEEAGSPAENPPPENPPPERNQGTIKQVQAAVRAAESQQLQELAKSPAGYEALILRLDELADFKDPLTIVTRLDNADLTKLAEAYIEQEKRGRELTKPSQVLETEAFLSQVAAIIASAILGATHKLKEEDSLRSDVFLVEPEAIRSDDVGHFLLREERDEPGSTIRHIMMSTPGPDIDGGLVPVEDLYLEEDSGAPLEAGDGIYGPDSKTQEVLETWKIYKELARVVREAPIALEQARKALVVARTLVNAPMCQGSARETAIENLKQAFWHYRTAQTKVNQGAAGAA
ncbi:MAG TPA: hypothetical protein ENK31_10585, partial [Nannocystis exedens]|nr:hypothetical protein [Nannocystis exedens]